MRTAPHAYHCRRRPRPAPPRLPPPCGRCKRLRVLPRHRKPAALFCCWRQSKSRWCLARLDRLSACPLAMANQVNAN